MSSLHIPRQAVWGRRKCVLVFGGACLVFWGLVIWAIRSVLQ